MKEIAIIGPSGSGKTQLAHKIAKKFDCILLSLDSLAIYKGIDIASAKPTLTQREGLVYHGIDIINPNEKFDASKFCNIYQQALSDAQKQNKSLLIVGGSSFYLKMLLEGLSPSPICSAKDHDIVKEQLLNLDAAYALLEKIDPLYAAKLYRTDRYRLEKALLIYQGTNLAPTEFFKKYPRTPIAQNIKIFELIVDKNELFQNVSNRTLQMLKDGLIEEVSFLINAYGRHPSPFGSIGIKETIDFLDEKISQNELIQQITTHTMQLAKKQKTFNSSQFHAKTVGEKGFIWQETFKLF